jgi:ribosome-associated protein
MQPEGAIERAPHRVAVRRQIAADDALKAILTSLDDSKAEDIVTIDIAGKSALADYMVVASGRSARHVSAIAEHIDRDLSEAGGRIARIEGVPHCDWVLLDAGDVIVHIFRPEVRSFYNLEKMWAADEPQPAPTKAPAQDQPGL